MKTLKKVLAMTLAFATAMTMFISASAFTDDADIRQTEAVGALSSLGIIKGNSDGSFAPQKTVTRGEMAKMIYVLRTGKDDGAVTYSSLSTTFTDIGSTWAAPYIKYCASMGIINGRSTTKFDPDATVTGLEAGKMLLVCMGYNAEKAGLTGATWGIQTAALGDENRLFEDVYQDLSVALNRENAAQEIYNTLDAKTVRFDGDDQAYTNKTQLGTDMETVGEKFLDLETKVGILTVSGNVGLATSGDDDKLVIEKLEGVENSVSKAFTDVTTDYSAQLGQTVKVMYKETTSTTGKKTTTVYGVYTSDENEVVVNAKASDIDAVSGEKKIKIDGVKYTVADDAVVYTKNAAAADADEKLAVTAKIGAMTNAELYKYVDETLCESDFDVTVISNDDDDDIDMIIVDQKVAAKLTTVNNDTVTYKTLDQGKTNGANSAVVELDLEDDEPEIYTGYEKDDYVFVDVDLFTDTTVITKADQVKGNVEATRDGEVKIGGVWYDTTYSNADTTLSLNKSATMYVYGTYAYYVDGTSATDLDTLVVKSVGDYKTLDEGIETKVIFEDGTQKVINVTAIGSKIGDEDGTAVTDKDNKGLKADVLYTYEEDDGDYVLTPVSDKTAEELSDVLAKTATGKEIYDSDTEAIDSCDVADDAVVYIKYVSAGDDKYKVITGKDLQGYKTIDGTVTYVYNTSDKEITYAFIATSDNVTSDNTLYGVVTKSYLQKNADGDKVVFVDLLTADGIKEGVETDETKNTFAKGDIVTFDGAYTMADNFEKLSEGGYAAISKYNSSTGLVSFEKGVGGYETAGKIVSDSVVIYINQKNSTWTVTTGTPGEAMNLSGSDTDFYANAYAYVNSDKEIELLVYEVNDKIQDSSEQPVELKAATSGSETPDEEPAE